MKTEADVTWFEAHVLVNHETRQIDLGIAAKLRASDETFATCRLTPDPKLLESFLKRFPSAHNIEVAPKDKAWPGDFPETQVPSGFDRNKFLRVAIEEANKDISWRGNGAAKKYTRKFEPIFGTGRFSWCAAFVTWCAEQAGLPLPMHVPGDSSGFTFALCEAWQQWAIRNKLWRNRHDTPQQGDIVLFDWDGAQDVDTDWEDHIGVFCEMDGDRYVCAEGNVNDRTAIKLRYKQNVQGFIAIPQGFTL